MNSKLKDKMTEKQKAFCDEYIISLNAKEAAIKAGYSKKSAKEIGHENLTKPHLRKYIDQRLEEKESDRIAMQDEILEHLTAVMRNDKQYLDHNDNIKIRERNRAAKLLGKRYALFVDNIKTNKDEDHQSNMTEEEKKKRLKELREKFQPEFKGADERAKS